MASWWCSSPLTTVTITTTKTPRHNSLTSHTSQFHLNNPSLPSSSLRCRVPRSNKPVPNNSTEPELLDCVGTGQDVECLINTEEEETAKKLDESTTKGIPCLAEGLWEGAVLVSPFFFWGTAMVAMKEVLPKYGPFFVSSFRLIPAGFLLVGFAALRGRPFPSGFKAWLSISLFALVDAACFQGFLAEGLQRTSAGLGSLFALEVQQSFESVELGSHEEEEMPCCHCFPLLTVKLLLPEDSWSSISELPLFTVTYLCKLGSITSS